MSLAVKKPYYNHIDRLWATAAARQLQRTADCTTQILTKYVNTDRDKLQRDSIAMPAEKRRNEIQQKLLMSGKQSREE